MSSSIDSGYYADQKLKLIKSKCKKSKSGKHKWKQFGQWPSIWIKCQHCKQTGYSK